MSNAETTLETENQHLRELLLRARAELEAAGFQGPIDEQITAALERARRQEDCERELGTARGRMRSLEEALLECVWALRNNMTGRNEAIAKAAELIPIPERLIRT